MENDKSGPANLASTTAPESEGLVFLTLGDGDFSFSLDFAKWLATNKTFGDQNGSLQLIATVIDSLEEIKQKYKNASFLLKKLEKFSEFSRLTATTCFNVNAVDAYDQNANALKGFGGADRVIFNHPHLGTESATLHFHFLCHLFHTVKETWMKSGGLFHLTLAAGQYSRWKCEQAAERHGMVVLDRCDFQPPHVSEPYYHFRRHQSGKSFANRTAGKSETITYARRYDREKLCASSWQPCWYDESIKKIERTEMKCPHCDKMFLEERSVKNHVMAKHPHDKKRRRDGAVFSCLQCEPCRIFENQRALDDHTQAKHQAVHLDLLPDWSNITKDTSTCDTQTSCEICDMVLDPKLDSSAHHIQAFTPVNLAQAIRLTERFKCVYCCKSFQEQRALRQHENFCRD